MYKERAALSVNKDMPYKKGDPPLHKFDFLMIMLIVFLIIFSSLMGRPCENESCCETRNQNLPRGACPFAMTFSLRYNSNN
ncbi:MAG: hypothetical protein ACK40V_11430 [Anaerolineales bacterium]